MVLAKRTRKSTQVCETRTCVRTCDGWPNEFVRKFAQLVAKTRKFHAYTVELRSACVDLRWVTKRWKPGVRRLAYEFQSKTLTCIDLRVRLARDLAAEWGSWSQDLPAHHQCLLGPRPARHYRCWVPQRLQSLPGNDERRKFFLYFFLKECKIFSICKTI